MEVFTHTYYIIIVTILTNNYIMIVNLFASRDKCIDWMNSSVDKITVIHSNFLTGFIILKPTSFAQILHKPAPLSSAPLTQAELRIVQSI